MNENTNIENHSEMTVGEILRNARTTGRRKREIQTISKLLCIREEFLQALEDGDYKVIPEDVYILGFARNYAMELGLDPDEIVNKLKREMGLVADVADEDEEDEESKNDSEDVADECGCKHSYKKYVKFLRKNWLWFVIGFVAVIAIAGVLVFAFLPSSENVVTESNVNVVEQVADVSEPKFSVAVRDRFGTENAENAVVILQAAEESWVKVEDARGNTIFSRVLVPGDVYYVPEGTGYKAVFGNAGGIDVWVNGTLAPKQGADHVRVSDISLNPEKLIQGNK